MLRKILWGIAVFLAVIIFSPSVNLPSKKQQRSPQSSPTPSPIITPSSKVFSPIFSPNGEYFVEFSLEKKENHAPQLILQGSGWESNYVVEGHTPPDWKWQPLWETTMEYDLMQTDNYTPPELLWNDQGYAIAFISPTNTVEVFTFAQSNLAADNRTYKVLEIKNHSSYPLSGNGYHLAVLNGNQIYLSNPEVGHLYTLFPTLQPIQSIDHLYNKRLHPIIFSLSPKSGIGLGGYENLSFLRESTVTSYTFPSKEFPDGYFKALISPGFTGLCVVSQSSGYIGYSILHRESGQFQTVTQGMQYSDCRKWVNNDTVLVEEHSYWMQNMHQYFLIDIRTGIKTLLTQEYRP